MIKRLCIFTINFAFNRQVLLNFLEKSLPKNIELFLFVPKECKGKFHSTRIKIFESDEIKYNSFFELRKFCKRNKIDRIFTLGALPQEGFVASFASAFTKTESLCHLVTNPFDQFKVSFDKFSIKAFFEYLLLYFLMVMCTRFYVGASDITEECKRKFFFAKKKIEFLRYPVDTDFFHPSNKLEARKKLNLPLNRKIVVFIGRIEYAKGSDIILELAKRNPELLFVLIGQLFDEKIKKANLENIKLPGPQAREALVGYYNSADLGLFPSRAEAGPLSAKESLSCGTPVIVPNKIGPRLIEPAIKTSLDIESIDKNLKDFFKLSEKKLNALSFNSRKFVIRENGYKISKNLYIAKLLN